MDAGGGARPSELRIVEFQFAHLPEQEIFCLSRRCDDAIGHGFSQFIRSCACLLRQREVFLQSVGAADRHGTSDSDQFTRLDVENFGILKVKDFFSCFHRVLRCWEGTDGLTAWETKCSLTVSL